MLRGAAWAAALRRPAATRQRVLEPGAVRATLAARAPERRGQQGPRTRGSPQESSSADARRTWRRPLEHLLAPEGAE
jgi:hypothetical protein